MTTVAEWHMQIRESFSIVFSQIQKHWSFLTFVPGFCLSNLSVCI